MNASKTKFITDIHTHSAFSFDGVGKLSSMLETAQNQGVAFYGIAEHFDYDVDVNAMEEDFHFIDDEEYFHTARHLQEDYQGVMNVLVGAEFGYCPDENAHSRYAFIVKKYNPDFIVNSVHARNGVDYFSVRPFYDEQGNLREKREVYGEYLQLIYQSLFAPYPYDIVAHVGYVARYAPYADKELRYADHREAFDKILKTLIEKDKILEVNAKGSRNAQTTPKREIVERYFELGGRNISYASDAHEESAILYDRENVIKMLKEIGFTHLTVPENGKYIKIEI